MPQITRLNKIWLIISGILASIIVFAHSNDENRKKYDWDKIGKVWSEFYYLPTEESLKKLDILLPSINYYRMPFDESNSYFLNYSEKIENSILNHIWMLEKEVFSGNLNAFLVCLKLKNISSHTECEPNLYEKCINIIGDLVRINPRLFLLGLKKGGISQREYVLVLGGMDTIRYTDREKAILRETILRIEAIESVKDEGLREIKKQCLEWLRSNEKEMQKIINIDWSVIKSPAGIGGSGVRSQEGPRGQVSKMKVDNPKGHR